MKNYFKANYDPDEIAHLKVLAKAFNIQPFVDNTIVNDKVWIELRGDVDDMNAFDKQYRQYLDYRQKLKARK